MPIFEIVKCIILVLLTTLLGIAALLLHRIGTIRKWEIEMEKERRNQPEFWDEHT